MRRLLHTLAGWLHARPRPGRRPPFLRLERLEDRTVPTAVAPTARLLLAAAPAAGGAAPAGLSPAQVRHAYGFDQIVFSPSGVRGDGSGQTIAIVDAYDQPNIANDLALFDAAFGLPNPPRFTKVNQSGGTALPAADQGWGLEISLDVEWAHAIAPGANILLVEAASNGSADLLTALNYARNQPGVSTVSLSWAAGEFTGESSFDSYFTTPAGHAGVTFVAASGDNGSAGAPNWPSVSANVLAVGGTQLYVDAAGNYIGETGWSGSGGGVSMGEAQPGYQKGVATQSATARAVPDVAYDGAAASAFAVYDTSSYAGWLEAYGTSAGAPQWAALVAIADQGRVLAGKGTLDGGTQTLPLLYQLPVSDFHDVTSGSNGGYSAGAGYDLVTGRGSPVANLVVAGLVGSTPAPASPGLPPGLTTVSVAVDPTTGAPTAFAVTTDGGLYEQAEGVYGYSYWGWRRIGSGVTSVSTIAHHDAGGAGGLEVFAVTTAGGLYEQIEGTNGFTSYGWRMVGSSVASVATVADGRAGAGVTVLAVTTAGGLYQQGEAAGGAGAAGWKQIGTEVASVTACAGPRGVETFAVTTANGLYEQTEGANGFGFSSWQRIGSSVTSVSAGVGASGNVEVFAVTTADGLYEQTEGAAGYALYGWRQIGAGVTSAAVGVDSASAMRVLALAADGSLYYQPEGAGGYTLNGWRGIGTSVVCVSAGPDRNSPLAVFAVTTAGGLYEEGSDSGGNFASAWSKIGDAVAPA